MKALKHWPKSMVLVASTSISSSTKPKAIHRERYRRLVRNYSSGNGFVSCSTDLVQSQDTKKNEQHYDCYQNAQNPLNHSLHLLLLVMSTPATVGRIIDDQRGTLLKSQKTTQKSTLMYQMRKEIWDKTGWFSGIPSNMRHSYHWGQLHTI